MTDKEKREKEILENLLKIEENIKLNIDSGTIKSIPPLINYMGMPLIKKGTLTSIQGPFGSHKSRISGNLCSLMVSNNCSNNIIGFQKSDNEPITIAYIDTERNKDEELPLALTDINEKSCSSSGSIPDNFRFTSIRSVPRHERLKAVVSFLDSVRKSTSNHIFVVLDVVTDCVASFNDLSETLVLIDELNNMAEYFNSTIAVVIHENPGSEKARGHLGTEVANKASLAMSISFLRKKNNLLTDKLVLKFLKTRSVKKPENSYLKYDSTVNNLVVVSEAEKREIESEKQVKAPIEEVLLALSIYIEKGSVTQQVLIQSMVDFFDCSTNTIKERLLEITENQYDIVDNIGSVYHLKNRTIKGKATTYEFIPLESEYEPDLTTLG